MQSKIQLLVTDPRSLWTPRELPGVLHWWRSDLGITVSSGQVSAWQDQINGSSFTQPSSSKQPDYYPTRLAYNNKPTLEFVAADQIHMTATGINYSPGDDISIIAIGNWSGPIGAQQLTMLGQNIPTAGRYEAFFTSVGSTPQPVAIRAYDFSNTSFTSVGTDASNPAVFGFTYSNVGAPELIKVFHNSNTLTSYGATAFANANPGIKSYQPLVLGANNNTTTTNFANYFEGEVAEIIVTKSYLSENDLQPLIDYVYLRYGIGASTLTDEKVYLDLYDESPLLLNMQIDDYQELPVISSNFSRTFRIPATGVNNKFFQNAFFVNSTDYDVSVKIPAEIFVDGEYFRKGQIRLNKIYTNEFSDRTDYEIFFLGESKDFAGQVGEGFLNSLLCFDLDHELLMSNVVTSWDAVAGTTNGLLDGNIVYPLVDMGYSWNDDGTPIENQIGINRTGYTGYSKPFTIGANRIERNYFRPWIRAKYLIDKIFSGTDYTYTSNFFTSNLFDGLYVNATGNTAQSTINAEVGSSEFEVLNLGQTLTPISSIPQNVEYPITIFDPSDVMGLTTFTANVSGSHTFEYSINIFSAHTGIGTLTHDFFYQINSGALVSLGTNTIVSNNITSSFSGTLTLTLAAGDRINFVVRGSWVVAATTFVVQDASLACTIAPIQVINPCSLLQDNIKTIDFFKSIVNLFKLVVAPDPANENNLIIEPYNDYIGSGTLRDWTDKLDTSVDFQIEPIFFSNTATIKFAYKSDLDFYNLDNEAKFKEVFGTLFYDSQQELLNDQRVVEPIFSPTILTSIIGGATGATGTVGTTDFVLPRLLSVESDENAQASGNYAKVVPIRPNIRLCFYNGKRNGGYTWYYDTDAGGTGTATTYPLMSPYLDPPGATGATGLNLNFEDESPYYIETISNVVTGQPTVYEEYWSQFVEEQYSPFARKFTGNFVLNHYDLKDFQFKDVIFVKDSYYRVLKIKDLQVGETQSTQVEMLKLLNYKPDITIPIADFEYVIDDDGITVTFTNLSQFATSYLWDFGDGSTSTSTNPVYVYDRVAGTELFPTRTVTLTAINANGSSQSIQAFQVLTTPVGTQAWWRASDGITLNGSDVASWEDIIQSIPLSQGTAANQPVYNATDANFNNKPSISFNRANLEYLVSPLTYPNYVPHTAGEDTAYMFVYKTSYANTQNLGLMSRTGGTATFNLFGYSSTTAYCRFDNQVATSTALQNLGTAAQWNAANWMFATYKASTGAYDFRRDNTSVLSGTGNINGTWASTTAWIYAGAHGGNGVITPLAGNYWEGQIVEMWLLHKDLDATDRTNFANYLSTRYNL